MTLQALQNALLAAATAGDEEAAWMLRMLPQSVRLA